MTLRHGSLFAGYGGLDMAAQAVLGSELAWYSEIDPGACSVMARHHPGVPNLGDVTAIDWNAVEPVGLLTAGFPCQDISNAGQRAGIEGARSGLWKHVADAVRTLRPRHVLLENVSALLVRGLDRVAADLAEAGYDLRWCCLRASDVGAPHGRNRWFGYATPAEDTHGATGGERRFAAPGQAEGGGARADACGRGGAPATHADRTGPQGTEPAQGHELPARGVVANADGGRQPGHQERDGEPQREEADNELGLDADRHLLDWGQFEPAIRRWEALLGRSAPEPTEPGRNFNRVLSPRFVEFLMGLPAGYVTDTPGLTRAQLLRILGNGVVPQQGEAAFRFLLSVSALSAA